MMLRRPGPPRARRGSPVRGAGRRDGQVQLGPVTTEFGWPPPDLSSNSQWAFNRALRELGVDRGDAVDEFDALGLGRWRHTEDWQRTG